MHSLPIRAYASFLRDKLGFPSNCKEWPPNFRGFVPRCSLSPILMLMINTDTHRSPARGYPVRRIDPCCYNAVLGSHAIEWVEP